MRKLAAVAICLFALAQIALAEEPLLVRAKRQQCRCMKNNNGGLTCSCAKPQASGGTLQNAEQQQSQDLAYELTNVQTDQARCACLQIVFQGNPQYQCQCGDQGAYTSTTNQPSTAPTTTTTTPAPSTTTTTESTTTSTTTQAPTTTTTPAYVPTVTQSPGQCQCIMIRISGPASAQYQCQCQNTQAPAVDTTLPPTLPPLSFPIQTQSPSTLPPTSAPTTVTSPPAQTMYTSSPPAVYQPVGTINTTEQGCFCVDPYSSSVQPQCGCSCNCLTLLVSVPNGVCGCPQDTQGNIQPTQTTQTEYQQVFTTQPPQTLPPTTPAPVTQPNPLTTAINPTNGQDQYPLTTTCVMYVGVQTSPCMCLPQYDQCAQNVCCLKSKFRSHKKIEQQSEPSTIDMLMKVLQTLKNKLEN
ncbi:unnamed protein product [Caenorhabditis auriculariae]|uniref:Uncharacterized protein n=1 Tax=Caenorhabditis auriculariae TaxID=2777116 RepID=A0A8S1HQ64_9PELO|nr:unnamed protein product [Caenorhabditis auriculariae]